MSQRLAWVLLLLLLFLPEAGAQFHETEAQAPRNALRYDTVPQRLRLFT